VFGHAVSFWTWRSLCLQHGLSDREAVEAMATLALTTATGPSPAPASRSHAAQPGIAPAPRTTNRLTSGHLKITGPPIPPSSPQPNAGRAGGRAVHNTLAMIRSKTGLEV
jgi:hypothetical protein